jgi:hypothetical protein
MKRIVIFALAATFALGGLTACEEAPSSVKEDRKLTEQNQSKKNKVVGFPKVKNFAESQQLKRYYEEVDDPNRTGYVYLLNYGKIMAEYTVKGKVSSLNSSFTAPETAQKVCDGCDRQVLPQAEPDGSYGDYPDGIFFWTTDGVLIEWSGDYQYSTERLELREPPQISLVKEVK